MELHKIQLSDAQKRKLLRGHCIQLKHAHLNNGADVVLDPAQGKKVRTAIRTGAGVRIQFVNDDLIRHNCVHGAGFKELLSKAKSKLLGLHNHLQQSGAYDTVKKVGKKIGKKLVNDAVQMAKQQAAAYVADQTADLNPAIKGIINKGANQLINSQAGYAQNYANSAIDGLGIGKTERKIIKGLKTVGKTVASVAKSKIGKQVLTTVAKTAIPAVLGAVSAETGVPAVALAPALTNATTNAIAGLGLELDVKPLKKPRKAPTKKKAGRPRKGGALVPSGY